MISSRDIRPRRSKSLDKVIRYDKDGIAARISDDEKDYDSMSEEQRPRNKRRTRSNEKRKKRKKRSPSPSIASSIEEDNDM